MTGRTNRRTLLGTIVGGVVLAGCTGDVEEEESTTTNETEAETEDGTDEEIEIEAETDDGTAEEIQTEEELTQEEIVALFEVILEDEGIEAETVDRTEDVLEVVYNATGSTDEAVRTEIDIVADVYARSVDAGLSTDRLEAFVQDPETGSILDSFVIETDWAVAYLNDEIEWDEYVDRIIETFESSDTAE